MNTNFGLQRYSLILKETNMSVFKIAAKSFDQAWNKYVEMGFKNYALKPDRDDYLIEIINS